MIDTHTDRKCETHMARYLYRETERIQIGRETHRQIRIDWYTHIHRKKERQIDGQREREEIICRKNM